MNKFKNQHLLIAVVVLSVLSTFFTFLFLMGSRDANRRLEANERDLQSVGKQITTSEEHLNHQIEGLTNWLKKQDEDWTAKQMGTKTELLDRFRAELKSAEIRLDNNSETLMKKTIDELRSLSTKLLEIEKRLSLLEPETKKP